MGADDGVIEDSAERHRGTGLIDIARVARKEDAGCSEVGDDVVLHNDAGDEGLGIEYARIDDASGMGIRIAHTARHVNPVLGRITNGIGFDDHLVLLTFNVLVAAFLADIGGTHGAIDGPRLGHEAVIRVEDEGVRDSDTVGHWSRIVGIFGAAADFQLVLAYEDLVGVGAYLVLGHDEMVLVVVGVGHHFAAFGEADYDVVDVEAFVIVVLTSLGTAEIAVAFDRRVQVGFTRQSAGRTEVEAQFETGLTGELPQVDACLPPLVGVEELLDSLTGVGRIIPRGREKSRQFVVVVA